MPLTHIPSGKELKRALRSQGWTLKDLATGHTQAIPPNRDVPLVTFSEPGDFAGQRNVLAQLKRSGFVWGESPETRKPDPVPHASAAPRALAPSVPYSPPSGLVAPDGSPLAEMPASTDAEAAFAALKDARDLVLLAREEAAHAEADLARATLRHHGALDGVKRAVAEMQASKIAFDGLFKLDV